MSIGLTYPTPWHLVSLMYSPFEMKTRVYGVFSEKHVRSLAEIFQKLGYERGMVVHGLDGLDEISNVGPTRIAEFKGGDLVEYTITPEDMGVKKASVSEIQRLTRHEQELLGAPGIPQEEKD